MYVYRAGKRKGKWKETNGCEQRTLNRPTKNFGSISTERDIQYASKKRKETAINLGNMRRNERTFRTSDPVKLSRIPTLHCSLFIVHSFTFNKFHLTYFIINVKKWTLYGKNYFAEVFKNVTRYRFENNCVKQSK